ncbi:MAG: hypothetical protein ACRBB4_09900 [Neptuniibacter sp.]
MQYSLITNFSNIIRGILICTVGITVLGCSSEEELLIDIKEPVILQCGDGTDLKIDAQSAHYIEMQNWFKSNKDGWSKSPASYVPKILVKGKAFTAIFLDEIVVVNIDSKQYVRKIDNKISIYGLCDK